MKTTLVILLVTALLGGTTDIKLKPEESSIKVFGTSSIHDWSSEVSKFTVKGKWNGEVINNLEVSINPTAIESGKSVMDDKTYEALKAKKFPEIKFAADQLNITGKKIKGKGQLTIAGKTREIDLNADILAMRGNEIQLQGAVDLKMTEFDVEPPTAMFGSIKAGDGVTVKYDILISK